MRRLCTSERERDQGIGSHGCGGLASLKPDRLL